MVNLQRAVAPASRAPPAMLLERLSAVHSIDGIHEVLEGDPLDDALGFEDQTVAIKRSERYYAPSRFEFADFVARQVLCSFLGHLQSSLSS